MCEWVWGSLLALLNRACNQMADRSVELLTQMIEKLRRTGDHGGRNLMKGKQFRMWLKWMCATLTRILSGCYATYWGCRVDECNQEIWLFLLIGVFTRKTSRMHKINNVINIIRNSDQFQIAFLHASNWSRHAFSDRLAITFESLHKFTGQSD